MNMKRVRLTRLLKSAILIGLTLAGTALLFAGLLGADVRVIALGLFAWILATAFIGWINRGIGLSMLERQHFIALELGRQHAETVGRLQSASKARGQMKYALGRTRADVRTGASVVKSQLEAATDGLRAVMEDQQKDLMHLMLRSFRSFDAGMLAAGKQNEADRERLESMLGDRFGAMELQTREAASRQHDIQELLLRSFRALDASLESQARAVKVLQEEGQVHAAERQAQLQNSLATILDELGAIASQQAQLPEVSNAQQTLLREVKNLAERRVDEFAAIELQGREAVSRQQDIQELLLKSFRALDASLESQARAVKVLQEEGQVHAAERQAQLQKLLATILDELGAISSRQALLPEVSNAQQALLHEMRKLAERLFDELATATNAALPIAEVGEKVKALHAMCAEQAETVQRLAQGKGIDTLVNASLSAATRSKSAMALARQLFDHVKPDMVMDIAAMAGLRERAPKVSMSPPMTRFSMEPSAILAVVEDLVETTPGLIVELGSGSSTLWIAGALERLGRGRLISFEHDPYYFAQTSEWLRLNGLAGWVDLRLAELRPCRMEDGAESLWYDTERFDDVDSVDVLLVDGPPQSAGPSARFPALERLRHKLVPGARVFVDDASRGDEQVMVERWRTGDPRLSPPRVVAGRMIAMTLGH